MSRGRAGPGRSDAGMVTVEAAIALCSFVVVLGLALAAIAAVTDQLRCTDAAREAARLTARGEPDRAMAAAERIAPRGAGVAIHRDGDTIAVEVNAAPLGLLPGLRLTGHAYAIAEPGAAETAEE
jgi:endonuclease YncB( thermonuclease family)